MTAPLRSPLAVQGEFPDDETLLADIIGTGLHAAGLIPVAEYVDTDSSRFPPPCVTCYAPPARTTVDRYGEMRTAFLYLDFIGPDRDAAKALADAGWKILAEYHDGGLWKGVQIHRIRRISEPTALPLRYTEDPNHREGGVTVNLRPHRTATVYP